jgi:predicted metal-dependent hydrolase
MSEIIQLGDISIEVELKNVKNVHLSVHPPMGRVTLVAPTETRLDVARAYAISKLSWIRNQQEKLILQARETERHFISRESHYVWGHRYLMSVVEKEEKPKVILSHKQILLQVRPQTPLEKRKSIIHEWHKSLLHAEIPALIEKWQHKLGVQVSKYFLQKMKTKWGSCNPHKQNIRINTELVKKPKELLEYIIVHELVHLLEPTHNERFISIMDKNYPTWSDARKELNELPLGAELW